MRELRQLLVPDPPDLFRFQSLAVPAWEGSLVEFPSFPYRRIDSILIAQETTMAAISANTWRSLGLSFVMIAAALFLVLSPPSGSGMLEAMTLSEGDCVVGPESIAQGLCCLCISGDPDVFGLCEKVADGGISKACENAAVVWCHPHSCAFN